MARRDGACLSHTCKSYIPWRVLLGLRINPVTYRLTCSKPSSRQKIERNLAIPFAIVSGTRVIGSMVTSLGRYSMRLASPFVLVVSITSQVPYIPFNTINFQVVYSDRRHHLWPVYGSLTYGPAPRSSWI